MLHGARLDPFVEEIFMSNAIAAALGRNSAYRASCSEQRKSEFRNTLAKRLRNETRRDAAPITDDEHCGVIREICSTLSKSFCDALSDQRFRYGTAQKALNLYLKFLWRCGAIPEPPHCPVDSMMLRTVGVTDAWTKSDCENRYRTWISALREKAEDRGLAQFEHEVWLESRRS